MKIYYNSKIAKLFTFIDGYKTIMLFGAVFTERDAISLKAEYHEGTHCNQYQALFATGFIIISIIALVSGLNGHAGWWMLWLLTIPVFLYYVWYLVEYLIRLCIYRNHKKAYHNIVFEREAFDLENDWNKPGIFRRESEGFSFLKYYRRSIIVSRRRYFEEQRSGNEAIYHCVEIDTDHDTYFEVLDLMSKDESDTVSPDKVNNVLNQLRQGSCFNIHTQSIVSFKVIEKRNNAIFIKFNPTPAPSEQHGIIYRFQINNKKYVFMFSNNYDGKRDLIQNADEDVDCMTYAKDTSIYSNNSFFVFV